MAKKTAKAAAEESRIIFDKGDYYVIATSEDRNTDVYVIDVNRGLNFSMHGDDVNESFSRVMKEYIKARGDWDDKGPREAAVLLEACKVATDWLNEYRNGKWPVLR